jgi:hypothetical protein
MRREISKAIKTLQLAERSTSPSEELMVQHALDVIIKELEKDAKKGEKNG